MNKENHHPSKNHHVAWADRIGLNKLWAKDILSCSENFGTPNYYNMVKRFRNDIINIKNGPQLRTIVDNYVDTDLEDWKKKLYNQWAEEDPTSNQYDSWKRDTLVRINQLGMERLCNFMIQLLEDYGFCFYESSIEEDEISLSD